MGGFLVFVGLGLLCLRMGLVGDWLDTAYVESSAWGISCPVFVCASPFVFNCVNVSCVNV